MGKAANNEFIKLKATFFNNVAVGMAVTGVAVPYFVAFSHTVEMNQFLHDVFEGKISIDSPAFERGLNPLLAIFCAFALSFIFRTLASATIRDVED